MRKGRDSVMSEMMILNALVGSTKVLVASGIGLLIGKNQLCSLGLDPNGLRQWT